uniref:STX17-like N-terminal domain-containing protein n=1 Tax=Heliothis virescens TaxID=7102 RepID=A0A2A4IX41_HELVI
MDDEDKLPLKRVEFSLNKFNEVAIPHHLDLLRQHKANIIKYSAAGEWARARAEQTHARRVAAQLRGLLAELDALRRRVRDADLARFDAQTQRSRDTTLRAIVDYLGSSPVSIDRASEAQVAASATSTESVGVVAHALEDDALAPHIQLVVQHDEAALREREELLRGWSELQAELRALHDVWQTAQAAALAQREQVLRVPLRLNYLGDWSQLTFLFL